MGNEVYLLTTSDSKEIGMKDATDESGNKVGSLGVIDCGPSAWNVEAERNMFLRYRPWLEQQFGDGQGVVLDMSWWAYVYFCVTGAEMRIPPNQSVKIEAHPKMKVMHSTQGMSNWVENGKYTLPTSLQFPRLLGISSEHAAYLYQCFGKPVRFVHNGIDIPPFYPKSSEGFLLSLNRMSREKGILNAIDVALDCQIPMKLVGDDVHIADQNFAFEVQDRCSQSKGLVEYIGSVDNEQKWDYIKRCKALISCPDRTWVEAFGIMTIEGFSQGKPMISLINGGMKDTVKHGENGFLCENVSQMKEILRNGAQVLVQEGEYYKKKTLKLEDLDPQVIRKSAEQFSTENMARQYLELCQGVFEDKIGFQW